MSVLSLKIPLKVLRSTKPENKSNILHVKTEQVDSASPGTAAAPKPKLPDVL